MHEVSMRKCARITLSVLWVGIEASELPTYEVLPNLQYFFTEFEEKVVEHQSLSMLEFVLNPVLARWWVAHKESISEWTQCPILLEIRFRE